MPAAPARAASTAALSARMLVWNAISSIVLMIRPTRSLDSRMPLMPVSISFSAAFESATVRSTRCIRAAASFEFCAFCCVIDDIS
jgi:hypothetical protein